MWPRADNCSDICALFVLICFRHFISCRRQLLNQRAPAKRILFSSPVGGLELFTFSVDFTFIFKVSF